MASAIVSMIRQAKHLQVSIMPPATSPSVAKAAAGDVALSITVVLDQSGSMAASAKPNGDEMAQLYSKTDLTKRATEIVAKALGPGDTLTIIGYSTTAVTIMPRMQMTVAGQEHATKAIGAIKDGGCTALWDGLKMGLNEAFGGGTGGGGDGGRMQVVLLLTDGVPDPSPVLGEVEEFKRYLAGREIPLFTIGFGYGMNSKFLTELAGVGGTFNRFIFIPDGSMVITSFVNLMAHLKTLFAKRCVLWVSKGLVGNVAGELKTMLVEGGKEIHLGPLNYGQERSVLFEDVSLLDGFECVEWVLTYIRPNGEEATIRGVAKTAEVEEVAFGALDEVYFAKVISAVHKATRIANVNLPAAQALIADAMEAVAGAGAGAGAGLKGLLGDLEDQLSEALSTREAWSVWGAHYFRAWEDACLRRVRSNFKDKTMAAFGGVEFDRLVDKYNAICNNLPVMSPSIVPYGGGGGGYGGGGGGMATGIPLMSATVYASSFNNASGGCFGGDGRVMVLRNGGLVEKHVRDIRAGDRLATGSRVECVLKYANVETVSLEKPWVTENGQMGAPLEITPWHPVIYQGQWEFPINLMGGNKDGNGYKHNDYVYNFVLSDRGCIDINGFTCCTLGHGMEGRVIGHAFYGTEKVVDDLKQFPGWASGEIVLTMENQVTSQTTGLVTAYVNT